MVPLLIAFLFLIAGFARVFNAYNDLNQMAADGARFAAVGNFPGTSALLRQRGHAADQERDDRRPDLPGARLVDVGRPVRGRGDGQGDRHAPTCS